jgi:hypothetical protein
MTFYQFAENSPWLTFFLFCVVGQVIITVSSRAMRHATLRKHGYPPAHCDADGDFKCNDEDED